MNLSDSRTAGQAEGHSTAGLPAASQQAAAGQSPATSRAVQGGSAIQETSAVPGQGATTRAHPQTASTPLIRLSAAEAVFSAIRQDIESGALEVGAKLSSEATLAAQYGVSRSVIREALRSCTALGLTVTKTGKGTFVVANSVANDLTLGQYSALDLNEARPHIEVPAAGLAAQRRTPEELEHLKDIVRAMLDETDPEAWVVLDATFHSAVAQASHNKVFASVVGEIRDALAHQSETLNLVADRQQLSDKEHKRILAAIESGDAGAASDAMAAHLSAVSAALDTILNNNK